MTSYEKELLVIKIQNIFTGIIKGLTCLLPLKNIIVLESSPDLADNTYAVYLELLKRKYNEKYKIYWFLNKQVPDLQPPENVYFHPKMVGGLLNKLKAKWISARAKFIIDSNNYVYKVHKKQIRIHLKHGLPMKDASAYNSAIGEVDLIPVPGEYWVDVCSKEHGIDPDIVKPLGFPRNDVLCPKEHGTKTVIWMPTYRNLAGEPDESYNFNKIMPFGLPLVDSAETLQEINSLFKKHGAYLLVRLHPAQNADGINLSELSNIKLCNDAFIKEHNTTLYSLLSYTDALISDYSSVYYDYLVLSKPIALATFDFEQYKKHNGILAKDYEEFKAMYPAVFLEKPEDLTAFFNGVFSEDKNIYKCKEAKEKYMGAHSNEAAKKVVDFMAENYGL